MSASQDHRELLAQLRSLVNAGESALMKGTPMIPLHRDTVTAIVSALEAALAVPGSGPPDQICGYPLQGWRLDTVQWSEIAGQPDGWIVSLKRERPNWAQNRREVIAMSRSDLGPLDAWEEALRIAQRSDARHDESGPSA